MEDVVRGGAVMAAAISEHGQDLTRPQTTATRTPAGWRIDGRKAFCTMSPAATVLLTAVTYVDDEGDERYGYAQIPADAPGVRIEGDWDALGMRASGSHSVTFDGVEMPPSALRGGFAVGDAAAFMDRNLSAGLFHASASLGIAEAAVATATAGIAKRGEPDARARMLIATNAIELGACRATIARGASLIDDLHAGHPAADPPDEDVIAVFAGAQAAKTFVNEVATRIVDRALALSGGAGYLNGSPLARAYRDVRAGAFMHPLGANRAYDLLGDVALGRPPVLR
jgi:alkylation response protein AidB-like acyl-CoA dehydrogenase